MVRADFARLFTNIGVAAVLLAGISISVAQGYKGFLALQDVPSPPPEDAATPAFSKLPPSPRHSADTGPVEEPAGYPATHQPASATVAAVKASAGPSRGLGERRLVQPAVWRNQRSVAPPQPGPRAQYRSPPATSGWPRMQPPVAAPWQQAPSYTPRGFGRPPAVRSGFGPSMGPRLGGKSCMGFG